MKFAHALLLAAVIAPLTLQACADDDGASTREAGSVVIIGAPPPGGGGSVSAIGTGCVTKGATTKTAVANVQFGFDEYSITPPDEISAGVNRIVVKNFGEEPHEIVITQAASADDLPISGGSVDLEAWPGKLYRVQEFAGNTICEGTFDLPAGDYVVFSNLEGSQGGDFELGMVAAFTVA